MITRTVADSYRSRLDECSCDVCQWTAVDAEARSGPASTMPKHHP